MLPFPEAVEPREIDSVAMKQVNDYFTPRVNILWRTLISCDETIAKWDNSDQFITRLRQKAEFCDYEDKIKYTLGSDNREM